MRVFPFLSLPLCLLVSLPCHTAAFAVGEPIFVDETSTRFPTPPPNDYSNQLTIGDIDGDLDLDLIFANGGGFVSPGSPEPQRVYINEGGVFTDESSTRLDFSGLCRGAELGDIDGDLDLDLILVQDFDRQPSLFVNDGSGFFTDVTADQLPAITLSSSRAQFADIDNDGDLDLYLADGGASRFGCGQFRIYVNDGTGFFTDETASRHPTESLCENMDVTFGDVDGDFDLDVRLGNRQAGESRLYLNDGTGVFASGGSVPADSSTYSYDFGDVDGDGDLDLLGANSRSGSSGEALFLNDGAGNYTDASNQLSPNPAGDDDNDSKFFDYDNDGDLDLIIGRLGGSAEKIYSNDGSGNFSQETGLIESNGDSTLDIMVADLTGDGRLDLVTAQGESGVFTNRIYINSTGPVDSRAPRIVATEQYPDTPDVAGPYVIRTEILDDMTSDRNFFSGELELRFRRDGGTDESVPLRYSGGQVYRAEIPGDGEGMIEYFIVARDQAGNLSQGPTLSFLVGSGQIFADGFESGDASRWTQIQP